MGVDPGGIAYQTQLKWRITVQLQDIWIIGGDESANSVWSGYVSIIHHLQRSGH